MDINYKFPTFLSRCVLFILINSKKLKTLKYLRLIRENRKILLTLRT